MVEDGRPQSGGIWLEMCDVVIMFKVSDSWCYCWCWTEERTGGAWPGLLYSAACSWNGMNELKPHKSGIHQTWLKQGKYQISEHQARHHHTCTVMLLSIYLTI